LPRAAAAPEALLLFLLHGLSTTHAVNSSHCSSPPRTPAGCGLLLLLLGLPPAAAALSLCRLLLLGAVPIITVRDLLVSSACSRCITIIFNI
jgi:hypothetical protein